MTNQTTYSGDVTLDDWHETPVTVRDPMDVFVAAGTVDGDLVVENAEYVFTGVDPGRAVSPPTPAETVAGDIEDAYVVRDGVAGDLVVENPEDVFVEPGAVAGDLHVRGAERTFEGGTDATGAGSDGPVPDDAPGTTGWQRSETLGDPTAGVSVTGAGHDLTVEDVTADLDLVVTGYDHDVRLEGRGATVRVHYCGYDNAVSVGPYLDCEVATESGYDNATESDPFPVADVVETTKAEAYGNVTFGRARVTYQIPASGEDWCPNCGEAADAVVERRQEDAFFLLGTPVWTFDEGGSAYDCEHCTRHLDVDLTPAERRELLR